MNILFMSLGTFYNLNESSVHLDVLKRLSENHDIWLACKNEDRPTEYKNELGIHVLRIHTGELKKVNMIQKGINTILVESQFKSAVKKYLSDIKFDLVIYTTPPITFASTVKYVKKKDDAKTYLMLKDIFPQNAVDIGIMNTSGLKGIVYKYFRNKEKQLYRYSDYIGCMSPANVEYIINNNPEIDPKNVGLCPNISIIEDMSVNDIMKKQIRAQFGIPQDRKVFVYGGNLGKPQGIPFLVECLRKCADEKCYFLIIGQGTEYPLIDNYLKSENIRNCKLMASLPKRDFEQLVAACDVGMIFLDYRFSIPNFPSRMLSYMKSKIPVLAVTDTATDIGEIITAGEYGWHCYSNDSAEFLQLINRIINTDNKTLHDMGENGFTYLKINYSPDVAYYSIINNI